MIFFNNKLIGIYKILIKLIEFKLVFTKKKV